MKGLHLADVVRRHGPGYLAAHPDALPSHRRALARSLACRTPALGGHVYVCTRCAAEHPLFHSCHHRACPRCGSLQTEDWLARQRALLLDVPYFHLVFTVPSELRRLVRTHQRALTDVLFRAAFRALRTLCRDPRHLGADRIGALAILHTWTRTLEWHPHIHMLVPGGGLAPDGRTFVTPRRRRSKYLVPVQALSGLFRRAFAALARRALPGLELPGAIFRKRWVVYAKPAVQGAERLLEYLGRYVHRTALSDRALLAQDDVSVTLRYRPSDGGPPRALRLPAHELLRRFLQHVLPRGLHRVRTFGLLHPAHRTTLRRLQLLLAPPAPAPAADADPSCDSPPPSRLRCPRCHEYALVRLRPLPRIVTVTPAAPPAPNAESP